MDRFTALLMGFLSVVLVNNFVFTKFLGTCPYLGVSGRIDRALGMGLAVTGPMDLMPTTPTFIEIHLQLGTAIRVF